MFWDNPVFRTNPEDETERMIQDLRFGLIPQQLRNVKPVKGCNLTDAQRRVLAQIDGMLLPFVSKPLVYSHEIDRRFPVKDRKIVLALLYGRAIRVLRERGPLPGTHRTSEIGAFSDYHYRIESACS